MNRPIEPEKKQKLLERCLDAVTASGDLDFSINALAKTVNTSGRMLIYHFGSKPALQRELIALLESRLRNNMLLFQRESPENSDGMSHSITALWEHLTRPQMRGMLVLWIALVQRAATDEENRRFFRLEHEKWIEFLDDHIQDRELAHALFFLLQGALLDYLATGDTERGERTLSTFAAQLERKK